MKAINKITPIAKFLQFLSPGYGSCFRCGLPWSIVNGHSTRYNKSYGMFPLCEKCWSDLTPSERMPYYKELFNEWEHADIKRDWSEIEKAVNNGL